jgi:hypothetical protein
VETSNGATVIQANNVNTFGEQWGDGWKERLEQRITGNKDNFTIKECTRKADEMQR